jgi:hypothetical protein
MIIRKDMNNILRVHGRIKEHNETPPAYTRKDSVIYQIYMLTLHKNLEHRNTRTLMSQNQRIFWTKRIAPDAKKVTRKCITCRKRNQRQSTTEIGTLQKTRTEGTLPFTHVSMDCGGLFSLTSQRRRGLRADTSGQFLAIICHSTKAIHLEYLGSLHTVEIVAALERFFSRRGVPNSITADNASLIVATAGLTGKTKENKKKEGIDKNNFKRNQIN